MENVPGMRLEQTREELHGLQCLHSKAADTFFPSWEDHWTVVDLENSDLSYKVFCNQDIRIQTICEDDRFLAAVQTDGKVTLLFTVGKKQKFPLCTNVNCSKQVKCICYKKYKKILSEHDPEDSQNYYWKKRRLPL